MILIPAELHVMMAGIKDLPQFTLHGAEGERLRFVVLPPVGHVEVMHPPLGN